VRYLIALIFSTLLFLSPGEEAKAQMLPTQTYTNGEEPVQIPDWSQINFSLLPPIQESGYLNFTANLIPQLGYNPSRSWQAGDAVASFLMLGDVQAAFRLEEFSLEKIAERTGITMANLPLSELGVMQKQTLKTLVQAIPGLADLTVKEIPPVQALVQTGWGVLEEASVLNQPLGELLDSYPQLNELSFTAIDLEQYQLSSIPGLIPTPLKTFARWQETFIEEIPGLQQVPFAQFPQALDTGLTLVGKVDVVWGAAEHGHPEVGADYYVSGSGEEGGLTQPVPCHAGEPCAYLELTDVLGLETGGTVKGKRWASGETQQVEGGFGVLGQVNGGKEPAGRLVYGSAFKVAVTETSEPEGQAQRGLYFRVCSRGLVDLGCTPYFIGPVPWFPVQEKGLIILAGADAPPVEIPESYQDQIDPILAQDQPQPTSDNTPVNRPCPEQPANGTEPANEILKQCQAHSGIATGQLAHPAPGFPLTSDFGSRPKPCANCSSFHPAVDIGTPMNTPIAAADGGTVIGAEHWDGYGKTVVIDHGNGEKTRYSHLNQINVAVGEQVSKGQKIALSGQTGYGTGPHLDFGIYRYEGSNWRTPKSAAVDPETYIKF
jgi:hypothetical protein